MKNLNIFLPLIALNLTPISAKAEEGISCMAKDGSSFVSTFMGVHSIGTIEMPGYQFMLVDLSIYLPGEGVKTYSLMELHHPTETMFTEDTDGYTQDPAMEFDLQTVKSERSEARHYGHISLTRKRGARHGFWSGLWTFPQGKKLEVKCHYSPEQG